MVCKISWTFLVVFGVATISPVFSAGDHQTVGLNEVVFVIFSQPDSFHTRRAEVFMNKFKDHALELKEKTYTLLMLHDRWPEVGSWTLFPIIEDLAEIMDGKKWVFFSQVDTTVDVIKLLSVLQKYDHEKKIFLGKALRDKEFAIIHHFEEPNKYMYPDFAAGMALSRSLINRLANILKINTNNRNSFSIDPKYEFAKFIYDEAKQIALTNVPEFCAGNEGPECVTGFPNKLPDCGRGISIDDVFFGVKTCKNFHTDRIPVIKDTWVKDVKHIKFFSDYEDTSIPTINLGVKNTERGHCAKTLAILKNIFNNGETRDIDWIVIADDDTLISVPRLRKFLACFNPNESLAIGERYGYRTSMGQGYDYLTGGAGMVLSRKALHRLIDTGLCRCSSDNAPDDMVIFGTCLLQLGIPVTHSPLFHQARVNDYSDGYLSHQLPISFHKFYANDPRKDYKRWLQDENILKRRHDEL
ncbi:beta-1,3-glucosyltransferase-like [Tubulanus polymorphus]|uniref:beta-1,3-glucosyltransferase-like n=1 Tax=Tubulanus polymorphus TaxID=672921 RepID=UPI003DA51F71